jgi:hypothetical protein
MCKYTGDRNVKIPNSRIPMLKGCLGILFRALRMYSARHSMLNGLSCKTEPKERTCEFSGATV